MWVWHFSCGVLCSLHTTRDPCLPSLPCRGTGCVACPDPVCALCRPPLGEPLPPAPPDRCSAVGGETASAAPRAPRQRARDADRRPAPPPASAPRPARSYARVLLSKRAERTRQRTRPRVSLATLSECYSMAFGRLRRVWARPAPHCARPAAPSASTGPARPRPPTPTPAAGAARSPRAARARL